MIALNDPPGSPRRERSRPTARCPSCRLTVYVDVRPNGARFCALCHRPLPPPPPGPVTDLPGQPGLSL
jgi:hypothetical protein